MSSFVLTKPELEIKDALPLAPETGRKHLAPLFQGKYKTFGKVEDIISVLLAKGKDPLAFRASMSVSSAEIVLEVIYIHNILMAAPTISTSAQRNKSYRMNIQREER